MDRPTLSIRLTKGEKEMIIVAHFMKSNNRFNVGIRLSDYLVYLFFGQKIFVSRLSRKFRLDFDTEFDFLGVTYG